MLKKTVIIYILVFSIIACAPIRSPLEKRLENGDIPQFNEYISPMYVPIQPMYSPVTFDFNYSVAMNISVTVQSSTQNQTEYFEITGSQKIAKLGDLLTRDLNVNKVSKGSDTISLNQLLEVRMLTDKFGEVHEIEVTAPALIASNIEQKKIDEFIASVRESMKGYATILPKNPVRSGDSIFKMDKSLWSKVMAEFGDNINIDNNFEYKIKGWSYFNKNKVIVASIDEIMNLDVSKMLEANADLVAAKAAVDKAAANLAALGIDEPLGIEKLILIMKISGYCLYDPESFQIVDGYTLVTVNTPPSEHIKISVKILIHQSAKLKK